MPGIKTSIGRVMILVSYLAFGLAALRNADGMWASLTFTVAILAVCTSTLGAFARKDRIPWAGFALSAWTSLLIWLLLGQSVGDLNGHPIPFFSRLASRFHEHINPKASGGGDLIAYRQVSQALEVVVVGFIGSLLARFVARERAEC